MSNPKDTAATLAAQLDDALASLHLAPVRHKELLDLRAAADDVACRLAYFHDQYVPLDLAGHDDALAAAVAQWDALPAGAVHRGDPTLARMIELSRPLRRLHEAGITVKGVTRFSAAEQDFAALLGDNFAALSEPWCSLKRGMRQGAVAMRFRRAQVAVVQRFVTALVDLGVVELVGYEHPHHAASQLSWVPAELSHLPATLGPRAPLQARLRIVDRSRQSLVTGEWLNAYAAHLLHDQLERTAVRHEIYTNVRYSAPADIIQVSGDFDVMVEAAGQVAVVECKSGRLDVARGDFTDVLAKADGLRRVFSSTASDVTLATLLLFNPAATPVEVVHEALAGSQVVAITPEQVRGWAMSLLSSLGDLR